MREFFILLISVFVSVNVYASHLIGASITYTHLTGNNYEVTLKVYRDCSGVPLASGYPISFKSSTCGLDFSQILPLLQTNDVSQVCPTALTTCNGGSNPGTEENVYKGTVTLPPCSDWIISWNSGNRSPNITNLLNPSIVSIYVENTLNNIVGVNNNSPSFSGIPTPYISVGQLSKLSFGGVDIDGDSLYYQFIQPKEFVLFPSGAINPIPYVSPYTINDPIVTALGMNLNPLTGEMCFTPTQSQICVVAILVSEYRNNFLIGTQIKELQVVVSSAVANNAPTAGGASPSCSNSGGMVITTQGSSVVPIDGNSINMCDNDNVCFTVNFSDPDGNNVSVISNIATAIPSASFTVAGNGTQNPVGTFCWTTTPADLGFNAFTVSVEDDNCPISALIDYTYDVTVTNSCPSCISDAGTMNVSPISVCGNLIANAIHNSDHVLDADDVLNFILHDVSGNNLGTVLATNSTPSFNFLPSLTFGTTYYISSIVGNDDGAGNVDVTDPCLSVSAGTPIVWSALPIAIDQSPVFCEDVQGLGTIAGIDLTTYNNAIDGGLGATISWFTDLALTVVVATPTNETVSNTQTYYALVDNGNCTDTATVMFTVNALPIAIDQSPVFCEDVQGLGTIAGIDLTTYNNAIDGGLGATISWFTDLALTVVVATPTNETVSNTQTYYALVDNGNCTDTATVMFTVNALPIAIDQSPVFCEDVQGLGTIAGIDLTTYNNAIDGGLGATISWFTDLALTVVVATPTNETVSNTQTYYALVDNGNCTDTATVVFTVNALPIPDFTVIDGCEDSLIIFNDTSIPVGQTLLWNFEDGEITNQSPVATHIYISSGVKNVKLLVTDNITGCIDSIIKTVNIFQKPTVKFSMDPFEGVISDPLVNFYNNSTNVNTSFLWDFGGLDTSTLENTTYIFPEDTGTYLIALKITDNNGCSNIATQHLIFKSDFSIFIPNAFTPNGDGVNDVFMPLGVDMKQDDYLFSIYNRWGELMFSTTVIGEGWDGTYKGKRVDQGLYVWKIKLTDLLGLYHHEQGKITVIR